jgi:hypothetical protein
LCGCVVFLLFVFAAFLALGFLNNVLTGQDAGLSMVFLLLTGIMILFFLGLSRLFRSL